MSLNLEIRQLKTLLALRDTGSLVAAAEQLCLTQSALSHQLKELEGQLGRPLFQRKSRPVRFSEAGARLLQLAEQVLAAMADAERDLHRLLHGEAGRLFMAIECHSCFNWLMPVLDAYRPRWPQVELDFSGGFTFEPLPALARSEVDLVVTTDPQPLRNLVYEPLFDCEMLLAVAPGHPLAGQAWVSPQALADQCLITYPVAPARLDIFNRFLTPAGVRPQTRQTELTLMMVQMVAAGRGVCCLPNWVLADYGNQVRGLRLGQGLWSRVYLALRAETRASAYAQDFIRLAREHCFASLQGIRPPKT